MWISSIPQIIPLLMLVWSKLNLFWDYNSAVETYCSKARADAMTTGAMLRAVKFLPTISLETLV